MSVWDQWHSDLFSPNREWLLQQPDAAAWDAECRRLGTELQRRAAVAQAYRDPSPHSTEDDGERRRTAQLAWHVWRRHWRDIVSLEGPCGGIEISRRLERGEGRIRGICSRESNGPQEGVSYSSLGGDPVADVLLADAVLYGQTAAIVLLEQRFLPVANKIARSRGLPMSERVGDLWRTFYAGFIAQQRLKSYRGEAGLTPFISVAFSRALRSMQAEFASEFRRLTDLSPEMQWAELREELSEDRRRHFESLFEDQEPETARPESISQRMSKVVALLSPEEHRAWSRRLDGVRAQRLERIARDPSAAQVVFEELERTDCQRALTGLLKDGLATLDEVQQLIIVWHVSRIPNREIAARLRIEPGNVTRARQKGVGQLQTWLKSRLGDADPQALACRDCLEDHGVSDLLSMIAASLAEEPLPVPTSPMATDRENP